MIRNKSFKFQLLPTEAQKEYFAKCFGCVRFIYNRMLSDKIAHYKEFGNMLYNTPAQYKDEFPWLKEVDSRALCNAQLQLQAAYTNFFNHKNVGYPKFRTKKSGRNFYTTNHDGVCAIRIEGKSIRLPKIGFIKFRQHRQIPETYRIKSAIIELSPAGRYTISITTEYDWEVPDVKLSKDLALGLDYSLPHFYVDSQGIKADMPHFYREAEAKLAREQRKLSKMKRGSANYEKQRQRVARRHAHVANCRKDWLHKRSKDLSDRYDYVFVEDLNLSNLAKSLNFGKSTNDNGFGMFRKILAYKLFERGKVFLKIDKWFPSSKMCSECGAINSGLALKTREWTCECGAHHDRDINAAINIKNVGLSMIG